MEGYRKHTEFWLGNQKQNACNLYSEWTASIIGRDNIWLTIYSYLRPSAPPRAPPPEFQGQHIKKTTAVSFHILTNSLLPMILRCCVDEDSASIVK